MHSASIAVQAVVKLYQNISAADEVDYLKDLRFLRCAQQHYSQNLRPLCEFHCVPLRTTAELR